MKTGPALYFCFSSFKSYFIGKENWEHFASVLTGKGHKSTFKTYWSGCVDAVSGPQRCFQCVQCPGQSICSGFYCLFYSVVEGSLARTAWSDCWECHSPGMSSHFYSICLGQYLGIRILAHFPGSLLASQRPRNPAKGCYVSADPPVFLFLLCVIRSRSLRIYFW